jgi:hypothetical protein
MTMSRRVFFASLLLAKSAQSKTIRVAVLETFTSAAGAMALLVHHENTKTRDIFAEWLQKHSRADVRIRSDHEQESTAKIFRVRMCFGRGLVLLEKPLPIKERDILTIVSDERP